MANPSDREILARLGDSITFFVRNRDGSTEAVHVGGANVEDRRTVDGMYCYAPGLDGVTDQPMAGKSLRYALRQTVAAYRRNRREETMP